MGHKVKSWARLLLVPAAFLIGFLCLIPFHLVLYFTLENGSMISGVDTQGFERLFSPFIVSLFSILAGHKIVKTAKLEMAITVFLVYLLLWIVVSVISIFSPTIFSLSVTFGWQSVLALLGAIIGIIIAFQMNKDEPITEKVEEE